MCMAASIKLCESYIQQRHSNIATFCVHAYAAHVLHETQVKLQTCLWSIHTAIPILQ